MIRLKAIEIEVKRPSYFYEKALVKQVETFKKYLLESAESLGVYIEDIYLDESSGNIVVRFETIEDEKFAGQYRLTALVERLAKKHLSYNEQI